MRNIMAETGLGVLMALFLVVGFVNTVFAEGMGSAFEMKVQLGHSASVETAAFSPDGKYIVSSSIDNTCKLWDIASGKEIKTFTGHSDRILSVAFSPDGKYIVSGSDDTTCKLYRVVSGKEIKTFTCIRMQRVSSVAFSPDGKYIVSGSWNLTGPGECKLWDTVSGKEVKTFTGYSAGVESEELSDFTSVTFSPDGKYIVSSSNDKTCKLWDVASGKEVKTFKGHSAAVATAAFSPDGKYIVSGSYDKTVKLWDTASAKEVKTFTGHQGWVFSVAFSPDGKYIISVSGSDKDETTCKLWDAASGKEIKTFGLNSTGLLSFAISHDGKYIVSDSPGGTAGLWDVASGREIKSFTWLSGTGLSSVISSVCFSPDGKYIVSGSCDKTVKLWDAASGKEIKTFTGHSSGVTSVAFSPDGKYIVSGSYDKSVKLWDVVSGKEVRTLTWSSAVSLSEDFPGSFTSVSFSPDGRYIAAGSFDCTCKLWDAASGKEIKSFTGHHGWVISVSFSPDSKYLISGSGYLSGYMDNTCRLWDIASGKEIKSFTGLSSEDTSVAFSPDGEYFVSGSGDCKLWDVASGKEIKTFTGHSSGVTSVAFSPDGEYIVSGSKDSTCKLWDIYSGKEIKTFKGHSSGVTSVAFSPDGKYIVSGSLDSTTRVWNVKTGEWVGFMKHRNGKDWIIFDSDGNWDSSRHGGDMVAMVKGMDCWSIDQFAVKNNRPDLILARLPGSDKSIISEYNKQYKKRIAKLEKIYGIKESDLSSDVHVPEVKILKTDRDGKTVNLSIKLTDTQYDMVSYNIYVNDVPVYAEIGKKIKRCRTFAVTEKVELSNDDNKIEVSCFNEKGAESYRAMTTVSYDGKTKGNLYFIGFGVADYKDDSINDLRYSENDVLDLAKKFSAMEKDYDHIYVKTYTGKNVTSANIKAAKDFVRDAGVDDTVILFISGHGMHDSDEYKTYYYLTQDTDLKNIKGTAADFETVEDILAGINPRMKLFLMDTCDSGEMDDLPAKKKVTAGDKNAKGMPRTPRGIAIGYTDNRGYFDRGRFIYNDLFRRTGAVVFSSSKGGEASWEFDSLKNGAFTEAILEGLSGRADADKNSIVTIDELRDYVSESVVKYTDNRQHSVIDRDNIHVKFELPVNNAGD